MYGFNGGRSKYIADTIGDAGYVAAMPDFFRKEPWFHSTDVPMETKLEWLT